MILILAKVGTQALEEVGALYVAHVVPGAHFRIKRRVGRSWSKALWVRCTEIRNTGSGAVHFLELS